MTKIFFCSLDQKHILPDKPLLAQQIDNAINNQLNDFENHGN